MPTWALAAWLAAVKAPLSFLADAFHYRPLRLRAAAGFERWAAAAAAAGPAAIAAAIRERVVYVSDPLWGALDVVTAPAVTWARRAGDCDDFSYLAAELLRRAGLETWVVTYFCWRLADAHVACAYRDAEDRFGLLDQGHLTDGRPTLAAAAAAGRPSGRVAATLAQRYGRGADFIGRWIIAAGAPRRTSS